MKDLPNIYTILEKTNFEKKVKNYVSIAEKAPKDMITVQQVQQFAFGIVQEFYEEILIANEIKAEERFECAAGRLYSQCEIHKNNENGCIGCGNYKRKE